jgi:hypothetical protein
MRKTPPPPIEKWVRNQINHTADYRHVLRNRVDRVLQFRDYIPASMCEGLADCLRELAEIAASYERRLRPDIQPGAKIIHGTVVKKEIAP